MHQNGSSVFFGTPSRFESYRPGAPQLDICSRGPLWSPVFLILSNCSRGLDLETSVFIYNDCLCEESI
jgi:hypothetical protein